MHSRKMMTGLALAALMTSTQTALAGPVDQADRIDSIAYAFDVDSADRAGISVLDEVQMAGIDGALLPLIMGIAAVDLALMGVFWGIYVPTYLVGESGTVGKY